MCATVYGRRHLVKATDVTLAESSGNLLPGGWLKVTCGLTACTPGSPPGPTLGNECGKILPLPLLTVIAVPSYERVNTPR